MRLCTIPFALRPTTMSNYLVWLVSSYPSPSLQLEIAGKNPVPTYSNDSPDVDRFQLIEQIFISGSQQTSGHLIHRFK